MLNARLRWQKRAAQLQSQVGHGVVGASDSAPAPMPIPPSGCRRVEVDMGQRDRETRPERSRGLPRGSGVVAIETMAAKPQLVLVTGSERVGKGGRSS